MDEIESWFNEYADDIYNYLVYYTGTHDVDDLIQDTFVKAMRHRHSFRDDSSVKTWLIAIARNTALDRMKKEKKFLPWKTDYAENKLSASESNEEIIIKNEQKEHLLNNIYDLPRKKRDVIVLRGIMELSAKETGQILGWRENKVNVTMHRAMNDLKAVYSTASPGRDRQGG